MEDDQYERLRVAVFHLRISKQKAITEALEMWLRQHASPKARRE